MAAIHDRGVATRRSIVLTTMLAVLTGCGATGPTPVAPAVPTSPTATSPAASVLPAGTLPFRPASNAAPPEARQKALQAVLDGAVAVFHASGITAAVTGADGSWAGSAGTGGDGHALVPAAMMNIGSITKTFTTAEIKYLAHRGLLDLDAPASRYLHAALLARGPTVRQLLSMTSGLPEFFTDAYASAVLADPTRHWSPEQNLTYATDQPVAPGGGYHYTNTNFLFLGQLIERVTGLNYAAALRRDVLAGNQGRIALQDAEAPTPPLGGPDQSTGARPDGRYVPNRALASSGGAIGGIATDAPALARWGYTLYGGLLLPAEQIREMTTPLTPGYGLGTVIRHSVARGDTVGHDGRIFGYTAHLVVIPTRQLAVAVLIPGDQDPALFADQLADAVLN